MNICKYTINILTEKKIQSIHDLFTALQFDSIAEQKFDVATKQYSINGVNIKILKGWNMNNHRSLQPQICRTNLFINKIKYWICNFSKEMKRPSVLLIRGLGEREWKYDWKKSLFSFCSSLHTVGRACINFIRTDGSYTGTSKYTCTCIYKHVH